MQRSVFKPHSEATAEHGWIRWAVKLREKRRARWIASLCWLNGAEHSAVSKETKARISFFSSFLSFGEKLPDDAGARGFAPAALFYLPLQQIFPNEGVERPQGRDQSRSLGRRSRCPMRAVAQRHLKPSFWTHQKIVLFLLGCWFFDHFNVSDGLRLSCTVEHLCASDFVWVRENMDNKRHLLFWTMSSWT